MFGDKKVGLNNLPKLRCLVFVNLTQLVTWENETSIEELLLSHWPEDMSVGHLD